MKYLLLSTTSILFLFIISGSGNPTPAVTSKAGYIQTQQNYYNCFSGSPAAITKNGNAILKIDVLGTAAASFQWSSNIMNYQSSYIDCSSNTNCCVYVNTPTSGSYTMTYFFNIDPCSSLPYCERRYKHVVINSSATLNCDWDIVSITDPNPSGLWINGGC